MTTLILGTTLALPAMAQTAPTPPRPHHAAPHHTMRHSSAATQRETIDDKGPFTPEANAAYNGGGVILESAPGGPPPPASAAVGMPPSRPMPPR